MLALVYFCVFVLFCVRVLLMLWCFGMTHQNAANLKELEALYVLDLQKATTLCYVINLNSIVVYLYLYLCNCIYLCLYLTPKENVLIAWVVNKKNWGIRFIATEFARPWGGHRLPMFFYMFFVCKFLFVLYALCRSHSEIRRLQIEGLQIGKNSLHANCQCARRDHKKATNMLCHYQQFYLYSVLLTFVCGIEENTTRLEVRSIDKGCKWKRHWWN